MAYTLHSNRADSLGVNGGTSTALNFGGGATLFTAIVGYYSSAGGELTAGDCSCTGASVLTRDVHVITDNGDGACMIISGAITNSGNETFSISRLTCFASVCLSTWIGSVATPLDQVNQFGSTGAVTTVQPGSVTPVETNELVLCGYGGDFSGSPLSINGGFTITNQQPTVGGASYASSLAYLIQTSISAANPTWSGFNSRAASCIATYKDTPSATGRVFVASNLSGLQPSGPFFQDPLG
jgi:hypothetical protein